MKKIPVILTFALVALSSCDFLNLTDPDAFDESKFYQSEEDLEGLLASSYQAYRNAMNDLFFVTEMKSDNATTTNVGDNGGLYYTFVSHQVTSSNTKVLDMYTYFYKIIHRANLTITHIDDITWNSTEDRARVLSEAQFLRALGHFYLVRLWGPVTKLDHVVTSTSEANTAKRDSEEDVYQFIISDLNDVIAQGALPATYASGDSMYGHATLTAAYAILGRVYLQYAATLNHPECYTSAINALTKAEEVSGFAGLELNYSKLFKSENKQNSEIIFSAQYKSTQNECSYFSQYFQPYGITGLTSQLSGRGFDTGLGNLYKSFETTSNGFDKSDRRIATAIVAYTDGTYYTKKYVSLESSAGYGDNDWYEIRFADVYLMLAEAYERVGETDKAIEYLNKVRMRTGNSINDYATSMTNAQYAALCPTLRDAIFHERRVELCFENHRWFDLQRLYPDKNDFAAYMRSVQEEHASNKFSDFQAYEVLLPIPYDETFLNPGLGQNDGYTAYEKE